MSKKKKIASSATLFSILVICLLPRTSTAELPIGEALSIGEFSVFENIYIRETGPPVTETDTFTVPNPNSTWILRAITDNINDDSKNVSSFTLTINGKKVLKPNQFNQNVNLVEVPVTLLTTNKLVAKLAGKPGGLLALMIIGTDNNSPSISILQPLEGELLTNNRPTISGEYSDDISGINTDSLTILLDNVDITPKTFVGINSFEFSPRTPISDGVHTLSVNVEDNGGNMVQEAISFSTDATPPVVDIIEPSNLSVFNSSPVTVSVTINDKNMDENSSVTINGIVASFDDINWVATLPLFEGTNNLVATAMDSAGNIASDAISVRLDTAPPLVVIESPANGDRLITETIPVAGTVNDIMPGSSINDDDVTVTVNGEPAAIKNRTFFLPAIPLSIGTNTITAVAIDRAGNSASTTIEVSREPDLRGIRILIVEGNAQRARINRALPLPLTVRAQRKDGRPEVGRPVMFDVSRGDGLLGDPAENLRSVTVLTDETGIAQIDFTLGSRTGEGFHRVRVTTPGSLTFAEFCETAEVSEPVNISVVEPPPGQSPINQPLTHPISAIVTDTGGNPVQGVPVTFQVDIGGGNFNGADSIVAITNPDGIAEAEWTLGPAVGISNNEASANFPENQGFPATFIVSGVAAGPVEETRVSGIVQDSAGNPIAGARAIIRDTDLEAFTGADGRFTIAGVLPGGHHVGILGSAANDPVNNIFFPDIDFAIEAISGVDNTLDQIVVLPFLDQANAKLAGGDKDVILTMADVPGFSLKVFAHSTFVRDSNTGALVQQPVVLSNSQVKFDKVPMAPPQGSTPLVVGTIQPVGVTFNPPAEVCYPNTAGLAPGDVADIFAFHHDIGNFVSIGPGTVSEDGSVVCSDPGFGIVQSGWHCTIRNPAPTGNCANNCSADVSWAIRNPGDRTGFAAPVVMCWIIDKKLDPEISPPEQEKAFVLLRFTPGGGSNDLEPLWSVDNPNIVEIDGSPSNGNSVTLIAKSAGSTILRSPVYRIPLPDDPNGDKTCQVLIDVKVGKVAFDINKVKIQNLNLVQGEDKVKCAMELFDGTVGAGPKLVDLNFFLTDDTDKENIIFTVNNLSKEVGSSVINITPVGLASKKMKPFFLEAFPKEFENELVDGKPICSDEMILVAVPQLTADSFDKWLVDNADLSWTKDLPPIYSKVIIGNVDKDPEPVPEEGRCDEWTEEIIDISKSNVHPEAFFEMRSHYEEKGYGNQATYKANGEVFKKEDGVKAGTADKVSPNKSLLGHFDADVEPFIWAAQLDGNPVEGDVEVLSLDFKLSTPLLHEQENLKLYLKARPVNPAGITLEPGKCEPENGVTGQ